MHLPTVARSSPLGYRARTGASCPCETAPKAGSKLPIPEKREGIELRSDGWGCFENTIQTAA